MRLSPACNPLLVYPHLRHCHRRRRRYSSCHPYLTGLPPTTGTVHDDTPSSATSSPFTTHTIATYTAMPPTMTHMLQSLQPSTRSSAQCSLTPHATYSSPKSSNNLPTNLVNNPGSIYSTIPPPRSHGATLPPPLHGRPTLHATRLTSTAPPPRYSNLEAQQHTNMAALRASTAPNATSPSVRLRRRRAPATMDSTTASGADFTPRTNGPHQPWLRHDALRLRAL